MVGSRIFDVFLLPVADKELKRLPKKVQKKIREFLVELNQPYIISAKKIKGTENTYRVRIGDYRVLYKIYTNELILVIIKIAHRKHVYR